MAVPIPRSAQQEARLARALDHEDQRGDEEHGVKYGEFINALARENVCVDRKILESWR